MALVRGSNPIWFEVDLTANAFDDTFYLFVLENDIPYIPATVYHDPDGNIPWNFPIRFLANGTLPIDIFFDPDVVYRLEFRQGPTQSDPLIYLVENYSPGGGGGGDTTVDLTTDNQITNPQFSIVNFESPFTLTSASTQIIDIGPGWSLSLTGTGNVTLTQAPLNNSSSTVNPTNAPYALEINLSGSWSEAILIQRFDQNGMLWANKNVSSSITARIEGAPQNISAILVDSNGTTLGEVLSSTIVTDDFTEYTGWALLPDTTNPDIPPAAYIEYQLSLPTNVDIFVTSVQLVAGDVEAFTPGFEQETIERQVDHTFHYYRDSLLRESKDSILTGWDFGLNPWQFWPVTTTNIANNTYIADQTIVIQQAFVDSATANNVSTERASVAQNYGFQVTAVTATNQFAILQYIHPDTVRNQWGGIMSSLVQLEALKQDDSALNIKMRLIYRSGLPPTLSQTVPVASWTALGEPVFSAGWTAITPKNDPTYAIVNGENVLIFEGMELPQSDNANMTLAIIIYTLNPMVESGTPDNLVFNKVSLTPTRFAIDANALSYDETLSRCYFYYETSFAPAGATSINGPQRVTQVNAVYAPMNAFVNSSVEVENVANGFGLQYKTIKARVPNLSFFSGTSTTANRVEAFLNGSSAVSNAEVTLSTFFTSFGADGVYGFSFRGTDLSSMLTPIATTSGGSAGILYQYVADARLGL